MVKTQMGRFIQKLTTEYFNQYDYLYTHDDVPGYEEAVREFDETLGGKPSQKLVTIFTLFCRHINDCIISDREAAAFILALRALRDEIPA